MGDDKDLETPLWTPQASTPTPAAKSSAVAAAPSPSVPLAGVPPGLAGRYDVLAEVGHGGMGVVYRARDRETEETVALKVLKAEIAARPDHIEHFKSELRLARKITHKNVCRTHELLRFDDTVVIAMEFVEGDSLRAVLKRFGGVPLRRGVEWLRQMCSALAEAHAQGIVHRDLKPENVLVDREGQIRIMDFGIAHSLETDKLEAGAVVGTPAYMSPEQAEGKPLDGRSDIYALGLIAYEMFTGRQAFGGATAVTLLRQRLVESPPAPRSVEPYLPAFLERVILKCLERDPQKRYASVRDLEEALAKHEDEAEDERIELPPRLVQAQLSDLALLAAAGLGLIAYVATASFSSPESLVRVRLTRPMLFERARGELVARGWTPPLAPTLATSTDPLPYEFLARRFGNEEARRRLPQEFPHVLLQVRFPKAENPRETAATVTYAPDGALRSVELPVIGFVPAGSAGLAREAALELAQQELRKVYGVDAGALAPEQEGTLTEGTRRGHSFRFTSPDSTGIQRQYLVNVFDRVTQLRKDHKLPEDFERRRSSRLGAVVFFVWFAAVLLLFVLRRVYTQIQRREVVCLALFGAAAAGTTVSSGAGIEIAVAYLVFATLLACMAVVVSSTACFLARGPWPHVVASYLAAVRMRPRAVETGLAFSRGAALGLAIMGGRALLVHFGAASDLTWPLPAGRTFLGAPLPWFAFVGEGVIACFFVVIGLAFVLSLGRRLSARSLPLMLLGGASWAALDLGTFPIDGFNIAVSFAMTAALSFVLVHFDALTLAAASLTYYVWGAGYPLLQMFELVGNAQVLVFFGLWAIGTLAAIYFGFWPLLQRAGQRAAQLVS